MFWSKRSFQAFYSRSLPELLFNLGVRVTLGYIQQKPHGINPWGLLVHRKVAEAHTLTPPSKPIIFCKNQDFWGIFALFFNFAQNSI